MKKDKPCYLTILAVAALLFVTPPLATGVEAAQPISDREIIASLLSELKAGQKALETRMDRHSEILQQQIDQPFGAVDQGFEAVDQHFERVNQRFEAIHRRLDEISALMFVTIAGIFGLIGYIAWDRRTSSQRLHFGPSKDCGRELQAAANVGSRAAAS